MVTNEELEGEALVTIAFRCELWRWPHQVLQEYIGQQRATLNFSTWLAVPYIPALKGEFYGTRDNQRRLTKELV